MNEAIRRQRDRKREESDSETTRITARPVGHSWILAVSDPADPGGKDRILQWCRTKEACRELARVRNAEVMAKFRCIVALKEWVRVNGPVVLYYAVRISEW